MIGLTHYLTVAAILERQGRFLFVEERDGDGPRVLNQPAGHVEPGESLVAAVIRDVAEACCHGRVVATLEGGYELHALARSVEFFLRPFIGADMLP